MKPAAHNSFILTIWKPDIVDNVAQLSDQA